MERPPVSRSTSSHSGSTNPNPDLTSCDEMEETPSSTEPPDSRSNSFSNHSTTSGNGNGMQSSTSTSSQFTPQATLLSTAANPKKLTRTPSTKKSNVDAAKKEAAAIAASCAASNSGSQASDPDNPKQQKQQANAAPTQKRVPSGPKHKWTTDETDALVEGCNKVSIHFD